MDKNYNVAFLRDEVARIISDTIDVRRSSLQATANTESDWTRQNNVDEQINDLNVPPTDYEIDEFIAQCPFSNELLSDILLEVNPALPTNITFSNKAFEEFQHDITDWANNGTWLGGDDWPTVIDGVFYFSSKIFLQKSVRYSKNDLELPENRLYIARLSPSFKILEQLLASGLNLDALHWREFEELIFTLLQKDGYSVKLGPGRNDGGTDIVATKELAGIGPIMSVWQAKKKRTGNKVGIATIRELADTRDEFKASKGMIVTTTFLTQGALERVKRDEYILGKVDRNDLTEWIKRIL